MLLDMKARAPSWKERLQNDMMPHYRKFEETITRSLTERESKSP